MVLTKCLIEPKQNTNSPCYWWIVQGFCVVFFMWLPLSLFSFLPFFKKNFWLREGAKNPLQLWSLQSRNNCSLERARTENLVLVNLMLYFLIDTQGFVGCHHSSDRSFQFPGLIETKKAKAKNKQQTSAFTPQFVVLKLWGFKGLENNMASLRLESHRNFTGTQIANLKLYDNPSK